MAITYVGASGLSYNGVAITVGVPSGVQSGDLLICVFSTKGTISITSPTGWTQCDQSPALSSTRYITAFYKYAGESESNVQSSDSGTINIGQMFAFRGVDSTSPFDDIASSTVDTATTTMEYPSVTTVSNDALVFLACASSRDGASTTYVSGWSNANLTDLTEAADQCVSTSDGGGIHAAYGWKTLAGATGTTSATWGTSAAYFAYLTFALAPLSSAETITGEAASALAWINAATIS